MKTALFLFLATMPSTSSAEWGTAPAAVTRQPREASWAEKRQVMGLIGNTTGYYHEYQKAVEAERDLRRDLMEGSSRDYLAWARTAADVSLLEGKLKAEFEKVARATEASYRVGPNHRKGKVNGGLFDQRGANWAPQLLSEDVAYEVPRPGKKPVLMVARDSPRTLAQTLNDGKVYVSIEVLRRAVRNGSPAIVASTLEHEGVHFDDLIGPNGLISRSWDQYRAYGREVDVAGDIGLEKHERKDAEAERDSYWGRAIAMGIAAPTGVPTKPPLTSRKEYPYLVSPDQNFSDWDEITKRARKIAKEQARLRENLARVNRGEAPERLRDALNDRRPPPDGATAHDGCSGTGFWAGDVYFPAAPCGQALPAPAGTTAAPAAQAPSDPAATLPPPVRGIVSLSGLAERICANPAQAHAQGFHDDYKNSWVNPKDDPAAMPKCQGEVFRVLKQIAGDGATDYNSAYFQALADSLNAPQSAPFVPPEPEFDYPVPYGPGVPDCMQGDGRRCIRWRR